MRGHFYMAGEVTVAFALPSPPDYENKIEVTGEGAMLMRFAGNPRTEPDFGFLASLSTAPSLTVGGFTIDLSDFTVKTTTTLFLDIPDDNHFTVAYRVTCDISFTLMFKVAMPGFPTEVIAALSALLGDPTVTTDVQVYASTVTKRYSVRAGLQVYMGSLLGAYSCNPPAASGCRLHHIGRMVP